MAHLDFPHVLEEYKTGRCLRTSALHPRYEQVGAVFGAKQGYEYQGYFEANTPENLSGTTLQQGFNRKGLHAVGLVGVVTVLQWEDENTEGGVVTV